MTGLRIVMTLALVALFGAPANAQTVRVAHPAQLAPLISVKDGKTVGLVADILRAAAAREGITIVFIPITSRAAQPLADGSADAIAPMLISTKARQAYDFTNAFVITGGGLFVKAPTAAPTGLAELSGKTVVSPSFGPFVSYIQANFPLVRVVPTNSYAESLDLVVAGNADAAALNLEDGASAAAKYAGKITVPTTAFLREPLGLAVVKGQHADLVQRLNAGLAAISADGTLEKIEAQYHRPDALAP